MVQFVPARRDAVTDKILSQDLSTPISQFISEMQNAKDKKQSTETASKFLGQDVSGFSPEIQQKLIENKLKGDENKKYYDFQKELEGIKNTNKSKLVDTKQNAKDEVTKENFETYKNIFGEEWAALFQSLPKGAQNDLFKKTLEGTSRQESIDQIIKKFKKVQDDEAKNLDKINDHDAGLTPAERVARQDKRYTQNLPLYQESHARLKSYENQGEELDILDELSPQIKSIERLNINPQTGELIIPALASPEAQRFVKTVNDFTTQAKASYGTRVTNFDLNQFMKRLPTLANSEEGRRQIIAQMKIINDINKAYESSLHEVIDEFGGIRNIDYDVAEKVAGQRSKEQISKLKGEFKNISNKANKSYQLSIDELKKIVPKDHVAVEKADGDMGYIEKSKLEDFLKVKGNKVL